MPKDRIEYVLEKKGKSVIRIYLKDIDKKYYHEHKEELFCPNELCDAHMEYCHGPKRAFFRTKRSKVENEVIIEEHTLDCPYGIDHEAIKRPKSIFDPTYSSFVSDEHIERGLRRIFNQYKNENTSDNNVEKKAAKRKKVKKPITTSESGTVIKGKATIASPGEVNSDEESRTYEPKMYQVFVDDIQEKHFNDSWYVKGFVTDIVLGKDVVSINLKTVDGRTARMFFGELFHDYNEAQFLQLRYYKDYFDKQNKLNIPIFIICGGEVKEDEYNISIYIKSYKHILIDGMTHYGILRNLHVIE